MLSEKKKKNDDDIATLSAVSKATSKKYLDDTGLGHLSSLIISFVRNYAAAKTHNHDGVYAKSLHTHTTAQVTGLDSALAGKASTSHNHNGVYAPSSHSHSADNITSGVLPIGRGGTGSTNSVGAASTMLNALEPGEAAPRDDDWYVAKYAEDGNNTPVRRTHSALWSYIKSKCDGIYQPRGSYASSSHTHTIANVSNLQSTLDSKASVSHTHSNATATASGFMSNTDKAKLDGVSTDANKTIVDASFSATSTNPVQNKVVKAALDAKASSSHTHTTSQVSGLDAALAGKAPSSHTHTIANVTNLQSALDAKQPKGNYAAASHQHSANDIIDVLGVGHGGTGLNLYGSGNSGVPYVYRGQPQLANLGTVNNTVLMNNAGTLTFKQISASHISDLKSYLLNNIYRVGYVWISYTNTSPASIIGGSWVAITGRFPYFNAGTGQGGSNSHTLSINELASHSHIPSNRAFVYSPNNKGNCHSVIGNSMASVGWLNDKGYASEIVNTGNTGNGSPHNNMPSYQTLYAWRRTG